jgi:hypothetical protein
MIVGRADDGPGRLGPELGAGVGRGPGVRRGEAGNAPVAFGHGQAAPVIELLAGSGDRRRPADEGRQAFLVRPARPGDRDPAAGDEAKADVDVGLGDVLVDLAVGEASQGGVVGHDQDLGLGRTHAERATQHVFGERKSRCVRRAAHHLPTPTWTLRNRAPLTPWPT